MKWICTFGQRYNHDTHPVDTRITGSSYMVFEGEDWAECRTKMLAALGPYFAFDYPLEGTGMPEKEMDTRAMIVRWDLKEVK